MTTITSTPTLNLVLIGALLVLMTAVAVFDIRRLIIPNALNIAIFALGLASSFVNPAVGLVEAIAAALLGGAFMAAVLITFRRLRGYDGLGMGDVKFVVASGTWIGAASVPAALAISSMTALGYVLIRYASGRPIAATERIAFGPFLAFGFSLVASIQIATGLAFIDLLLS